MRTYLILSLTLIMALCAVPAVAELQNVEVGGSIRIRGNYIGNCFTSFTGPQPTPEVRWGGASVRKRPIGGPFNPIVASIFDWDSRGDDVAMVEQRTRLHVNADFTDDVSAFIEMDSYDNWGEDFRSNYVTGIDGRANSADDVEIFQAYIETNGAYGLPIRTRTGRQELTFGSEWLVGNGDFAFFFTGLSFDATRVTYTGDSFTVDAFASKLAENFGSWGKDDTNFYGLYSTCNALENVSFDAYWLLLVDDTDIEDFAGGPVWEWVEDLWGVDDYDKTMIHTLGLRANGKYNAFDYDAEVAYQFGDANTLGTTFKPFFYGDDDADYDAWALKLDAGYAFDLKWHPRVFASFRYYGGEDNRDISFWDWANPFYKPKASVSFNRLFSDEICSGFMDLTKDLTNAWWGRLGVQGAATEKLRGAFFVTYYETVDPFDAPIYWTLGDNRIPWAPGLSWLTEENDSYLGTELSLFMEYHYSSDLVFEFGISHLFVGDGLEDGSYSRWNGSLFNGGTDTDDADYIYSGCKLYF